MAKITMMSGIASISGRVGNCCCKTMKAWYWKVCGEEYDAQH